MARTARCVTGCALMLLLCVSAPPACHAKKRRRKAKQTEATRAESASPGTPAATDEGVAGACASESSWRAPTGLAQGPLFGLGSCGITVLDAAQFTRERFETEFLERAPVLVRGLSKHAAESKEWDKEAFVAKYGRLPAATSVPLYTTQFGTPRSLDYAGSFQAKVSTFLGANETGADDLLFDRTAGQLGRSMFKAHGPLKQLFDIHDEPGADETKPLISVGGPGAGLGLHFHGQAWLSLLRGTKLWFLMPPGGMDSHEHYLSLALRRAAQWPRAVFEPAGADGSTNTRVPHVCEQRKGDVIYVPSLWLHSTLNDGDALGVGLQQTMIYPADLLDQAAQRGKTGANGVAHAMWLYPESAAARYKVASLTLEDMTARMQYAKEKRLKRGLKRVRAGARNALKEISHAIAAEPFSFQRRLEANTMQAMWTQEVRGSDRAVKSMLRGWEVTAELAVKAEQDGHMSMKQLVGVLLHIVTDANGYGQDDAVKEYEGLALSKDAATFNRFVNQQGGK